MLSSVALLIEFMDVREKILKNRDDRYQLINKYLSDYQVVTLHSNIPGSNKNIKQAYVLTSIYRGLIYKKFKPLKEIPLFGCDGPVYIYLFDKKIPLKQYMEELEENFVLGRFVDLDVYYQSMNSLNRNQPRRCYLCNDIAFNCSRSQKHSYVELLDYLCKKVDEELYNIVDDIIDYSMMGELNLDEKFGLVTPTTNGSHQDMDYLLMIKAKEAIKPFLVQMFALGYQKQSDLETLYYQAKKIGLDAENAMFTSTGDVNAYKGLIYNLGLFLLVIGYKMNSTFNMDEVFTTIARLVNNDSSNVGKDFGARKQASQGFPLVKYVISSYNLDIDRQSALIDLIINCEDSNFIKRAKTPQTYLQILEEFKKALVDKTLRAELNNRCIALNLSFGGSADLLIVSLFVKKIREIFKISN